MWLQITVRAQIKGKNAREQNRGRDGRKGMEGEGLEERREEGRKERMKERTTEERSGLYL